MVTVMLLPQSRPLTVADLDAVPDDGHRYELVDGTLIVTKRAAFESAGTASYCDGPTVVEWQRDEAAYVEVAAATGNEVFEVGEPYPVRLRPSDLLAR